ncbi:MAG: hypothetical protein IKO96_00070 [Spirochaetales bacterium]|nr:hypothetical protein [Spirochaetales bacterium]
MADMHGDIWGLLLSVALILSCLITSFLVARHGRKAFGDLCPEIARKIVHIGVSNWFFIYCHVFESDLWPIIGLAGFAVINAVMNMSGGLHVLMGQESTKRNWGLVQYPISIIILIMLRHFGVGDMVCVGCGVLGMGYGDGLASIIGMKVRSKNLPGKSRKTVAGSITMACITFVVVFLLNIFYKQGVEMATLVLVSLLAGLCASFVEAYTPFGLDNISVPLTIYLIAGLI